MANLKVKTVSSTQKGRFDGDLEKLINSVEDASIQFRTTPKANGVIMYSALVVYIDKVEPVETAAPTGVLPPLDSQTAE